MQKTPFGNIGFLCSIFSTFWQPSFKLEIAKWKWILAVLHQMNIWTRFSQHFMTFGSCIALSKEPYCFLHFTILRPNPLQKYCSINSESNDYFAALVQSFPTASCSHCIDIETGHQVKNIGCFKVNLQLCHYLSVAQLQIKTVGHSDSCYYSAPEWP